MALFWVLNGDWWMLCFFNAGSSIWKQIEPPKWFREVLFWSITFWTTPCDAETSDTHAVPRNAPAESGLVENLELFHTVNVSFGLRVDTLKLKHSFHVGLLVDLQTDEKTTLPSYSNWMIGSDVPLSFFPWRLEQLNNVTRKKKPARPCSSTLSPKSTLGDGKYISCCGGAADCLEGELTFAFDLFAKEGEVGVVELGTVCENSWDSVAFALVALDGIDLTSAAAAWACKITCFMLLKGFLTLRTNGFMMGKNGGQDVHVNASNCVGRKY